VIEFHKDALTDFAASINPVSRECTTFFRISKYIKHTIQFESKTREKASNNNGNEENSGSTNTIGGQF
jgi:hypothetical protein